MSEFLCPACECTEVRYADRLGTRVHACCRDCGMVYSFDPEGEDLADGESCCCRCGTGLGHGEGLDSEVCADCEAEDDDEREPDIDEAQEWADFDPDC